MAYSPATEQEAAEDMDIDLNSAPSTPDSPVTPSSPASSTGTICHSISASPAEHREHASEESTTPVLNSPIYHDSKINLVTSMLLIMSFVSKHNLTDAALQDLLNLIALLIPTPNIFITSMYKFKNFFSSTQLDYARIYFCKKCKSAIDGMVQGQCRSCRDQLDLKSFFIKISISEQLKNLFGKHGFYTWLQHRFTRSTRSGHLSDVYDGELYQNLSKPGEFLSFK